MNETWKDIPGYEGRYQVSDQGRVKALPRRLRFVSKAGREAWRITTERLCATNVTRKGYALVHFMVDGKRAVRTVHELVMLAFVGPRPADRDINHKDGRKTNNALDNLEYVTRSDNHNHAVALGLNRQAMRVVAVAQDGHPVEQYPSLGAAARAVGVTVGSIQYALRKGSSCRGFTWRLA